MSLRDYGWSDCFRESFDRLADAALEPARVVHVASGTFRVVTETRERQAVLAGRLKHAAASAADVPTVGDWVAVRTDDHATARIEHLLTRRTRLSRKVPGKRSEEQVVAANVDLVIVVMGLDGDYSLRRVERLLTTIWESGARPLVLLNKLDVCENAAERHAEVAASAPGVGVLLASCLSGDGTGAVRDAIRPGETAALVGSSGAGKSTLINRLLGEQAQATKSVLSDGRGRHTTTHRELFVLPDGGLLIDNPGIRELQLWSGEASLEQAFDEIVLLTRDCRYSDCSHETEPGCAVLAAVASGSLEPARLESFRALRKELRYLELRQNENSQRIQKQKWRAIHREMRRSGRHRRSGR